jgi:hypothetical protein
VHLDRQGIPSIDQYFRSVQLMRHLTETDFPQTPLAIEKSGKISKLESQTKASATRNAVNGQSN